MTTSPAPGSSRRSAHDTARARAATLQRRRALSPTDPEGEFLGGVHVVVEGDRAAPAVVMVHGIPGSVRDFRYLGPALVARDLCAVRVDMPGFGATARSVFPATRAPDRSVFVKKVMNALGFKRFAIVGHSFGGASALLCGALFADDVSAVVCVNSIGPRRHLSLGMPSEMMRPMADAMSLPVLGPHLHGAVARAYDARGLKSDIALDVHTVQHHGRIIGDLRFSELRTAARMVRCPALVASSADDPLVEPASSFALARAFVNAPLCSHLHTKTGRHYLQKSEAPAIAAWLAQHAR